MASDGAPQAAPMLSSSSSSSSRDCEMASKLQRATSITIQTLKEATDDFSEGRKIGQGSYGKVYHAKLENGDEIAVKMLHNESPGIDDERFQHEFENLMRLDHQNIVRLVGYCYETLHQPMHYMGRTIFAERTYRALCFEYMNNGSLEKHLCDECDGLDWITRYNIIKGTCQGLKHLHEGFGEPIYHLDLKPDNILLDENMVPKIADFGLSKLFGDKQTMTTKSHIGTIGYVPMEFLHGNIISNKFDIFSLGVVMVKIIAGRGGYSRSAEMPRQEFLEQVHENWRNRMLRTYHVSRPWEAYCEQVNICTEIALSCMETDRHKRPTIADIVYRLNGIEILIDEDLSGRASNTQSSMNENMVKLEALKEIEEEITYDEYYWGWGPRVPRVIGLIANILVRVTSPPWRHEEDMSRPGVDLVVIINHDMDDQILLATKEAMLMVIKRLGSKDRLSIVWAYGYCFMELTFMSDKGRSFARHRVNSLHEGRQSFGGVISWFLVESIGEAAKILRGRQVEEDSRAGFIMALFVSLDDDALMPETSSESEFPVHIFDLKYLLRKPARNQPCRLHHGSANHKVASYIADQYSGTYSMVELERDMKNVATAMKLFIGGITKVAAMSIDIAFTAHDGASISSIDSGGYCSHVNSEGHSGEIHINDIYAGETKNFIVKMKSVKGKEKLMTISGHYRSLNASKMLLAETDVFVLGSECSPENLAMHSEVATELMRLQFVKGISSLVQQAQLTSDNMDILWSTVRESKWGKRASKEALDVLDKEKEEILKQGSPYLLSWLSCHKWQRATSKGTCYDSAPFTRKC